MALRHDREALNRLIPSRKNEVRTPRTLHRHLRIRAGRPRTCAPAHGDILVGTTEPTVPATHSGLLRLSSPPRNRKKMSLNLLIAKNTKFDNNLCALLATKVLLSESYSTTRVNATVDRVSDVSKILRHYRCKVKSQYHVNMHDSKIFPPPFLRTEEA